MPNPIYAWFKGVTQGDIKGFGSWVGEDDQIGMEGSSLIQAFDHDINIPLDTATGLGVGRRQHGPVTLTKRIDKASPLLYAALVRNEGLTVTVKWFRYTQGGGGGQVHYYTILLEDARLVGMKEFFPPVMDQRMESWSHQETLKIRYRRITWTWEDGGVTATDDWQQTA